MHKFEANEKSSRIAVVIVAGGAGERAGGSLPKQFQELGGLSMVRWSLDACAASPQVSRVVLVLSEGGIDALEGELKGLEGVSLVTGGSDRSASVRAGLAALQHDPPEFVLIHDAARPGLSVEVITNLVEALKDADASAPALRVVDALKRMSGERATTVEREGLMRVQTPQAFRYELIAAAYENAAVSGVDDLAMVEDSARVRLIEGDQRLMKVTYPDDWDVAERLLVTQDVRVGSGYDVHAFTTGDHVTLCGVRVAHDKKLAGHSDADAGWHALTDAILGAMAEGDIGDHFPPSDPQWKGADSRVFLTHAVALAAARGYRIGNADITLICEAPKIGPHREAMRVATAEALGVAIDRVSVKATTTEKLGFTGRSEGIAAQASVTLVGRVRDV